MAQQHITKILKLLENDPEIFCREDLTFRAGLISSEIAAIKKNIKNNNLALCKGNRFYINDLGKNFIKENLETNKNINISPYFKDINLEYLKDTQSNPAVTRGINQLAKYLFDDNDALKEWSVEYNIHREFFGTTSKLKFLYSDIENYILTNKKLKVSEYFTKYTNAPYMLTKSIASILILKFLAKNKDNIAIYKDQEIQLKIDSILFTNIIGSPERFELSDINITEIPIIYEISKLVLTEPTYNVLEITKGLLKQIKNLNYYTIHTNNLSIKSIKFRNAICNAEDPINLICKELPRILCKKKIIECSNDILPLFKGCLDELNNKYESLLRDLYYFILEAFNVDNRKNLEERFIKAKNYFNTNDLCILYKNVIDSSISDKLWTERICICINQSLAPEDWNDLLVADFKIKIKELALKFMVIETTAGTKDIALDKSAITFLNKLRELSKPQKITILRRAAMEI